MIKGKVKQNYNKAVIQIVKLRYATGQDFFSHSDEIKGRQLVYINENLEMWAFVGS